MKLKPTPEEVAAQAEAKAQAFADVAMATDQAVKTCLDVIFTAHPDQEDAVVSGAMTALVRFGIERQQAAADAWVKQGKLGAVVTPREVVGYFVRYVQRSAEILLNKPARPDA
jgi:hypothetical protein